jgi:hypothetical protein
VTSLYRVAEPGDIVVMQTMDNPKSGIAGIPHALFGNVSRLLQGHYTHSGIVGPDGKVIHAVIGGTPRQESLQKLLRRKSAVLLRPKVSKKKRELAAAVAAEQLGTTYSLPTTVQAGATLALPDVVVRATRRKHKDVRRKKYMCSGLVGDAYMKAGAPIQTTKSPLNISPSGLLGAGNTSIVAFKGPNPKHFRLPAGNEQAAVAKKLGREPTRSEKATRAAVAGTSVAALAVPAVLMRKRLLRAARSAGARFAGVVSR